MPLGIPNVEIGKFIEKRSDDFQQNFVGVFSSDHINRFTSFHNLLKENNARYPFMIVITDKSDKNGTYCIREKISFCSTVLVSWA